MARLATINPDGTIRITPLTYGVEDGDIIFSTWKNSDAVRNTRRNGTASVLIDKPDRPTPASITPARRRCSATTSRPNSTANGSSATSGDYDQAVDSDKFLVGLGIGERAFIRFQPAKAVTWDFAKLPG